MSDVTSDKCATCGQPSPTPTKQDFNWAVLVGGYTGDGSADHKLFGLKNRDTRVPFFQSRAAAEGFLLEHQIGEYALIMEVVVEASPATELYFRKTGSRMKAAPRANDPSSQEPGHG